MHMVERAEVCAFLLLFDQSRMYWGTRERARKAERLQREAPIRAAPYHRTPLSSLENKWRMRLWER